MSAERFDIFFSGQIIAGHDETEVRARIGRLFKATPPQLERLFSGAVIKIKSGVDLDRAVKYRVAFRDAGALIDIRPAATATGDTAAASAPAASQTATMELLPPRTGSLIDCAPRITPAAIPDISDISLGSDEEPLDKRPPPPPAAIDTHDLTLGPARPDTALDDREPPPPAEIDTSGLTLNAPNTGSLEDCHPPAEAIEPPDISGLEIAPPERPDPP